MGGPGDKVPALGFDRRIPLAIGNRFGCSVGGRPVQPMDPAGEHQPIDQGHWRDGSHDEEHDRRVVVADEHRSRRHQDTCGHRPDDDQRSGNER